MSVASIPKSDLVSERIGSQAHNRFPTGSLAQVPRQGPSKAAYHPVDKEQLYRCVFICCVNPYAALRDALYMQIT